MMGENLWFFNNPENPGPAAGAGALRQEHPEKLFSGAEWSSRARVTHLATREPRLRAAVPLRAAPQGRGWEHDAGTDSDGPSSVVVQGLRPVQTAPSKVGAPPCGGVVHPLAVNLPALQ